MVIHGPPGFVPLSAAPRAPVQTSNAVNEAPAAHQILEKLHGEIAAETERVAELEKRIRVIEVEVGGWTPVPKPPSSKRLLGLVLVFVGGVFVTLIGKLVAAMVWR